MKTLSNIALFVAIVIAIPGPAHTVHNVRDAKVDYTGYHVYGIDLTTAPRDLEIEFEEYNTAHSRNVLEVAIPPSEVARFEARGLSTKLLTSDLGQQIQDELRIAPSKRTVQTNGSLPDFSWFDSYHSYDDHVKFWRDLNSAFSQNSEPFEVGRSYENRSIFGLQLFGDQETKGTKPKILWHATVHAREWISTMVVEYLAWNLISGFNSGDPLVHQFFNDYEFYIIPFHNPDGFVYTQTTDRLWRKNRQPRPNLNTTCIGTDGNRNWNYEWYFPPQDGPTTPNPCSQTFGGEYPSDTPENAALSLFSRKLSLQPGGIRSFIDWHSYGQLILLPWGFSCNVTLPKNVPQQLVVAQGIAAVIQNTTGEVYEAGVGCEILYQSIGSSRDYHYGALGTPYAWTVELRPDSAEEGGFVLPPELIRPTSEEWWEGIKYLLSNVVDG